MSITSPIIVQEQHRYFIQQLQNKCNIPTERFVHILRKLKEYGVLKLVKAKKEELDRSELYDTDETMADINTDNNDYLYIFTFVGIVIVNGFVFLSYPKYIKQKNPIDELKLVLKVLDKYNSDNEIVKLFNETNENKSFNLLAMLLFFLNDYYQNGSYHNTDISIEINGRGEVLWDKTINETLALICNNQPFYTELKTIKHVKDSNDYFKRLHECVITKASKELEDAGLLDLFELTSVNLTDETLDDFGDKDYILYRISREYSIQYNSWKQLILKALYTYIYNGGHFTDLDCFSIYGTTNFSQVWELICANVFENKLNTPLVCIDLPKTPSDKFSCIEGNHNTSLQDIIEKPFWTFAETTAVKTLIPDIVSIEKRSDKYYFAILDAKYYTPILIKGKTPKNQPGIESITKQYLYQLAFSDFLEEQGFDNDNVNNCFILPTDNPNETEKGEVYLKMFESIGLKPIQVRYLEASRVYHTYLDSRKMSLSALKL